MAVEVARVGHLVAIGAARHTVDVVGGEERIVGLEASVAVEVVGDAVAVTAPRVDTREERTIVSRAFRANARETIHKGKRMRSAAHRDWASPAR